MIKTLKGYVCCLTLLGLLVAEASAGDATTGLPIAAVEIRGNRYTQDFVIQRELVTRTGRHFDPESLAADLQRLDNLDIFSSLAAQVQRRADDSVTVVLQIRELPPVVPYISYDVNDQDGWSFGPAVKSVNLLGRDVFLAGYALFGGRESFLLDLSQPWWRGNHLSFDLDVSRNIRQNELDGFEETTTEITPRIGLWLGQHGRASMVASYMRIGADLPQVLLSGANEDELYRLGASVGYDSRDVWGNPHRGWLNEIEIWKTGGLLPGDGDFWTLHADIRRFQPVGEHTLVWAGLTSLQPGTMGRQVPVYMDYHLGGANSLRGYVVDDLGLELFGAHQMLTTIEYRIPLLQPREIRLFGLSADIGLGGTVFVDGGLAWTKSDDFELERARFGTGTGIRILLPAIDMTRIEIGYGEDGWRLYLATFSKMRAQRLRLR
ncbi:MAG: BamA/TamA family outer membrane protein [Gemmatimonadetes bacterium]|jgi:outer membrane protein assembly factor BamA|nr:BamA/TamA family outer membrane protein [Gemmatimonadota bacterium]MBT4610295.1 BamA/TamA family outer membrane protein [Gemmatimonadota bacterium]MBT5056347.1 BamA/TamA family outer membrane protein [Gemmatimonadota bacterium]MBT5145117.1 BamA/TamA family outer membrane protein [Gemmatimonadota bacterium]MBT5586931.1 BamA/TamA family outer membrane protein [Gemmatimonadota bacterium]